MPAEVSSGRSERVSSWPTKLERGLGPGAGAHFLDRGRAAALGRRLERGGPDGDHLLRIGGADGRDRVARVDRAHERIGGFDPDDVGDGSDVEERRGPGEDVLAPRGMGGEDRVVRAGEIDQEIGDGLGEPVGVGRPFREQHPHHPFDRRGRLRRAPATLPANEHVHVGVDLPRRGQRRKGRVEYGRAVVLGIDENAHQITLASFRSLSTRPATSSTTTPA